LREGEKLRFANLPACLPLKNFLVRPWISFTQIYLSSAPGRNNTHRSGQNPSPKMRHRRPTKCPHISSTSLGNWAKKKTCRNAASFRWQKGVKKKKRRSKTWVQPTSQSESYRPPRRPTGSLLGEGPKKKKKNMTENARIVGGFQKRVPCRRNLPFDPLGGIRPKAKKSTTPKTGKLYLKKLGVGGGDP